MARGETNVPILFSWSQVVGGPKGGNENNDAGSMDGLKLVRAVRGRWPPIKIVATSGHIGVAQTDLPEGGRFLPKPYSPGQVMDVLRELTAGG
jgi:CheY-like chemotaxis protein